MIKKILLFIILVFSFNNVNAWIEYSINTWLNWEVYWYNFWSTWWVLVSYVYDNWHKYKAYNLSWSLLWFVYSPSNTPITTILFKWSNWVVISMVENSIYRNDKYYYLDSTWIYYINWEYNYTDTLPKFIYNELLTHDTINSVFAWLFKEGVDFGTKREEYRFVIIIYPKIY